MYRKTMYITIFVQVKLTPSIKGFFNEDCHINLDIFAVFQERNSGQLVMSEVQLL